MEKIKIFDNLNLSKDKDFLRIIDNEKIYYSEDIIKINQAGKNQERIFLLTNKHIYNFKKKTLKKKLPLTSIIGISYSSISDEFIIHGNNDQYDYYYISENKIIIICLIILLYQELEDIIIPICEINEKSLKLYSTSEKDKKRNNQITKMNLSFKINTKSFVNKFRQLVEKDETNKNNLENDSNLKMNNYNNFSKESKIKIDNFQIIKEISRDIFGPIFLVKYLIDEKLYLLKSISKEFLIENNLIEKKILEKNILQLFEYPFLNKINFCFQKEEKIFFCFNYIEANNLYHELCICRFFPEDKVKFYASIIGLTLEMLHQHKIIYRNFNLKNILITKEGYLLFDKLHNVKLIEDSDFNYITYCCDNEYLAPEIILGFPQSYISDWWSYGIIIYEMLFGVPPFIHENNNDLYDMILNNEIIFPKKNNISAQAKDLIEKLLIKEKNERLGFEGGFEVIKKHYFFKGIDFDNLEKKLLKSPFQPKIQDEINDKIKTDFSSLNQNYKDFYQEYINQNRMEFLNKNQNKFSEFYE